jgi:glucuronate isomerase
MSLELRRRLFDELDALVLIDPHTHINALSPASRTLADILGYHYYTELAHSAGMPREQIEEEGISPKEKVRRLIANLGPIENTIQYSWFIEMCREFFGFEGERVTPDNWEPLYDTAERRMAQADWPKLVLAQSKLDAVFLTNDFDDPLEGFDTRVYIPCLRTDDLVFHLANPDVRKRLQNVFGATVENAASLRSAIGSLFEHFTANGAKACAISLPPDFTPTKVSPGRAATAIETLCAQGRGSDESHLRAAANFVFWTLAEFCADFRLPFDLMIGVNRGVYGAGVHQGRDLYDSRVSLIQYKELFNSFPQVTFPISVLASVTNQELTSYAWIFPNVVTNGHWWYSNTPTYIEHDASARLEAVPRTKQIGYYSDMYKRILAKILAERYVVDRGWSEEQAVAFGRQVLRGNVETIFGFGEHARAPAPREAAAVPMGIPVYSDDVTEFDTVPDVAPVVSSPGDRHAGAAFEINDDDRQTVIEIDELADVDAPTQIGSADDGPKSS